MTPEQEKAIGDLAYSTTTLAWSLGDGAPWKQVEPVAELVQENIATVLALGIDPEEEILVEDALDDVTRDVMAGKYLTPDTIPEEWDD